MHAHETKYLLQCENARRECTRHLYVPTGDTNLLHFSCLKVTREQKGNCISAEMNKPDYLIPLNWCGALAPANRAQNVTPMMTCRLMVAFKTVEIRCTGDSKCVVKVSVNGCLSLCVNPTTNWLLLVPHLSPEGSCGRLPSPLPP